ncbi:MAG: hypothetical protein BM485_15825 [Desulfobulbaceae bacterium DB1]|nr:MAG: hypothetical protein BM485_15825 [Desulfobulbaceae bacterium DB1]
MTASKGEITRNHILKTTRKLLIEKGFYHTAISEIIQASGVKKGNLYYHFAGKEELGLAVLQDARDEFFVFLEKSFQGDDPIEKVIRSCEAILTEQKKNNFVGGCLFGNTALEMSDNNDRFAVVINEVFSVWTDVLEHYFEDARKREILLSPIPSRLLAKTVVAVIEGGIMMSRVSKKETDLADCVRSLKMILGK